MTTTAMSENITTRIEKGILHLTINRESKLNALNIQTLKDIKEAILAIYENKEVQGVILTGAGAKAFAAGADIAEFANFNVTPTARWKCSVE
jgi:enoyl-CoA hydratase